VTGRHLLVTNDFPPKIGGIQQYLWELWSRLDPASFQVHTTPYADTEAFDAEQRFDIVRSREPFLLPYPWLTRRLDRAAHAFGASLHVIDPAVPLGLIGPSLDRPYVVVLHGAEVTVPGRLPGTKQALARVLDRATAVISAGEYALGEAERAVGRSLTNVVVPPGVDTDRFTPISPEQRSAIRAKYDIPGDAPFIFSVSRLVPRKGMDTLIEVAGSLQVFYPDLQVCIAGSGRDEERLKKRINVQRAPVRLLGRISEEDKAHLMGAADIFSMLCRNRWAGLEQEGFGIVFVEAAAAGTPQIAGRSGGADEAVLDGVTGVVVEADASISQLTRTFRELLDDRERRKRMSVASRTRSIESFSYDVLAERLSNALAQWTES
jgi:phosphatidylinositol alpha-1,6-mannosyltransferase